MNEQDQLLLLLDLGKRLNSEVRIYTKLRELKLVGTGDYFILHAYYFSDKYINLEKCLDKGLKPVLRPLSDFTAYARQMMYDCEYVLRGVGLTVNFSNSFGTKEVTIKADALGMEWTVNLTDVMQNPAKMVNWFYANHFNVDLPDHLWIDVNTLDKDPYE